MSDLQHFVLMMIATMMMMMMMMIHIENLVVDIEEQNYVVKLRSN